MENDIDKFIDETTAEEAKGYIAILTVNCHYFAVHLNSET